MSCSCGNKVYVRNVLKHFESSYITFSDSLVSVKDGKISIKPFCPEKYCYVVYCGPDDCSICAILHMNDNNSLHHFASIHKNFHPIILFSPREEELSELISNLSVLCYEYPVYIDVDFWRKNNIPEDKRFNSFLIGENGKPVLVGHPADNDKFWELLDEYLKRDDPENRRKSPKTP